MTEYNKLTTIVQSTGDQVPDNMSDYDEDELYKIMMEEP